MFSQKLTVRCICTFGVVDYLTFLFMFSIASVDLPPWFSAMSITLNSDVDLVSIFNSSILVSRVLKCLILQMIQFSISLGINICLYTLLKYSSLM